MLAPSTLDLGLEHARLDDADDPLGDLVLQLEHVVERTVELFRPQMRAGLGLDQLRGDAQPIAALADAALKHIARAELAPHLPDIDRLPFVNEARIARDDRAAILPVRGP